MASVNNYAAPSVSNYALASADRYALVDVLFGHDGSGGDSNTLNIDLSYESNCTHLPEWNLGAANSAVNPAPSTDINVAGSGLVAASDASIKVCAWALKHLIATNEGLVTMVFKDYVAATLIYVNVNAAMTALDVSKCTKLETLRSHQTSIDELDLTNCLSLVTVYAYQSPLSEIDLSNNHDIKIAGFAICAFTEAAMKSTIDGLLTHPTNTTNKDLFFHGQTTGAVADASTQICTDINTLADRDWNVTYDGTCAIT